jgi:hypothetical protein
MARDVVKHWREMRIRLIEFVKAFLSSYKDEMTPTMKTKIQAIRDALNND